VEVIGCIREPISLAYIAIPCADRLERIRNSFASVRVIASFLTIARALRVCVNRGGWAILVVGKLLPLALLALQLQALLQRRSIEVEVIGCIRELIILACIAVSCADRFVRMRNSNASLHAVASFLTIARSLRVCPKLVGWAIFVLVRHPPLALFTVVVELIGCPRE